jgi:hypothetical protein
LQPFSALPIHTSKLDANPGACVIADHEALYPQLMIIDEKADRERTVCFE